MKYKKIMFGIFVLLIIFTSVNFISAECCQELKDGSWCQNVDDTSKCKEDTKEVKTSCSKTSFCQTGTCVNSDTGKCMINVPRTKCVEEGGVWENADPKEIPACQLGCCLYGDQAAFVNQVECKQIASDYGVSINFREDINSQQKCFQQANTDEEGACVLESEYETTCLRTTKKECLEKKEKKSEVDELFDVPFEGDVDIEFHGGLLCTAEELDADCAPTENTQCSDDKAYFLDSCGNLANIYDEEMYPVESQEPRDYWTEIQDPKCEIEGTTSNSCGDCNYRGGTTCATYDSGDNGMPDSSPEHGNKVCRDLACYYDTDGDGRDERYEHGESWCAETEGTYPHLPADIERGSEEWNELTSLESVTQDYNIPGSRYVKLECRNGEVLEEPCKDYRNAFCMEESLAPTEQGDGMYTQASCVPNNWRNCFNKTDKNSCESSMCKWVEGYRFDFENVKENNDPLNYSEQGSCVPLVAPGFKFWENSGNAGQGAAREVIAYESHFTTKRDDLKKDAQFASQRCYSQNCYAIPGYGSDISPEDWEEIWDGDKGQTRIKDSDYISYRKGAYCPEKTGSFSGKQPDCTKSSGGNDKIAQPPIFVNHTQWINSLIYRARSLGDVGYKKSIGDYWGEKSAEEVISQIQKLDQDMENPKNISDKIVMYKAGEYTSQNQRMGDWIGKMFDKLTTGGSTNTF